ncbi:hypothetical protein, partial [Streptosporangium sp. NPDC048865]|uniref:hypothetical protein n=1 Tax=Streptosporangium sp. NPDC048865 TaxID=3155766 RepID=UPI00341B5D82
MPVATDRPDTRRVREPGTPPRPLVVLASIMLAAGTGAAFWLLPSRAQGEWAALDARGGAGTTPSAPAPGPAPPRNHPGGTGVSTNSRFTPALAGGIHSGG